MDRERMKGQGIDERGEGRNIPARNLIQDPRDTRCGVDPPISGRTFGEPFPRGEGGPRKG